VDLLLQNVHIPYDTIAHVVCAVGFCNAIDEFYSDIVHCL